jgi:hypothetical protein
MTLTLLMLSIFHSRDSDFTIIVHYGTVDTTTSDLIVVYTWYPLSMDFS